MEQERSSCCEDTKRLLSLGEKNWEDVALYIAGEPEVTYSMTTHSIVLGRAGNMTWE